MVFKFVSSTGELAASGLITTGKGELHGCEIHTDGTNNATLTIYDNTAGSGKILSKIVIVGASFFGGRNFCPPNGIGYSTGLYAVIAGTGAKFSIEYR